MALERGELAEAEAGEGCQEDEHPEARGYGVGDLWAPLRFDPQPLERGGATTRELMQRMGHSSVRAALIYQHLVNSRDRTIAAHIYGQIMKVRPDESGDASDT
ncbi:hypothetical protein [Streptomyces halstedii]|uniref:hypothetical protein n=1 Tax=Streptomyces halstedii TaxID=1944 RepID=UPI003F4D9B68